ncbi:hypothetical protein ACFE6N_13965, partial [Pedobacter sp. BG31]|uniref:hypothetical protein n=1 Tax=Pedobacter sp. BG31 TaxID=3349697 RepID=UPI0035F4B015
SRLSVSLRTPNLRVPNLYGLNQALSDVQRLHDLKISGVLFFGAQNLYLSVTAVPPSLQVIGFVPQPPGFPFLSGLGYLG